MNLKEKLDQRRATVGVIGLGNVGLPLAMEFARAGFKVVGIDTDPAKPAAIKAGRSYITDVPSAELARHVRAGRLSATTDFSALRRCDAVSICVPTPLRKSKDPDVSYIVAAVQQIAKYLHRGMLIVLESTTYPGTTREMVLPDLRAARTPPLQVGKDFFLAFSPERVDPGNKRYNTRTTPKIVGGITAACTDMARALYAPAVDRVVTVSSCEAAEMVKLLENTFRAVNIGLVNEIAQMCDRLKLDAWEVIEAAATKPFGFMPFFPGPGIGGHCIPLDPYYLSWKMKTLNFAARFIELAGEINSKMPEFTMLKLSRLLNARGKSLKGARILVVGVAYKPNVSDTREAPVLDVISLLRESGPRVEYHDPFVSRVTVGAGGHSGAGPTLRSATLTSARLKAADCVLITTAHAGVDYARILKSARLIFDTRNALRGRRAPNLIRL